MRVFGLRPEIGINRRKGDQKMKDLSVVVLAAGEGKRMKSKTPKVLHKLAGVPIIEHIIDTMDDMKCDKKVLVVGFKADEIKSALTHREVTFALQEDQLGTGHAVMMAEDQLPDSGHVLILLGDVPLIKPSTLKEFIEFHMVNKCSGTVLTTDMVDPTGYGRVVTQSNGEVIKIVEHRDASMEEKKICEINTGIMCFETNDLKQALKKISNTNDQAEYYLTDAFEILVKESRKACAFKTVDCTEVMGINSRVQLEEAEQILKKRILNRHMEEGVTIIDTQNTYVEKYVEIGMDTTLYPGTYLRGKTIIGEDCNIGPNAHLQDTIVNNGITIKDSTLLESIVDDNTVIGPYAYLRPKSDIGKNVKIGDFVEVKNSRIDDNSKVSHLSYIGDGDVGKNVNIGCGVVFVNYDGSKKHRTTVKDNAFVGCNVNLVAPVTIEENAYVAAGSTITKTVPENALAVARVRQDNKKDWVLRKKRRD